MSPTYYSIVIPAYNEEKVIEPTIKKVYKFLLNQKKPFEIIIADDGSSDKTPEIVTK